MRQYYFSIRTKIILIVSCVLCIAFIVAALLIRRLVYEHIVHEKTISTEILTDALTHDIKYNYEIKKDMSVQVVINKYMTYYRMIKKISFFDTSLMDAADSTFMDIGRRSEDIRIMDAVRFGKPSTVITRSNRHNIHVDSITPIFQGTKIVGAVYMEISIDDINATIMTIDKGMLAIMASLLILASLLLFALLRKAVLQRLNYLIRATYQIAGGEYDINIPDVKRDEIGKLSSAFNQMAHDIEKSRDDLERYSEHLEEMVSDRTSELQKAYDELKNAQGQMVLNEKMASLGVLIAGIAHEINTPVGAINNVSRNVYEKILLLARSLKEVESRCGNGDRLVSFLDYVIGRSLDVQQNTHWKTRREIENYLKENGVIRYKETSNSLVKLNITEIEKVRDYIDCIADEHLFTMVESFGDIIQAARICETSSGKIADIVRALKYYAYTDKDKVERMSINESIENSLILLRNKLKYRVDVVTSLGAELPMVCCTSEINQIWPNLINNAYDSICTLGEDFKGEIKIDTSHVDGNIVVRVIDNGPGIKPEIIDKVFDPFFTTKDIGEGTGLGLSIVSGIINKHNGTIRVESRAGCTLFEISLPAEGAAVAAVRGNP